MLPASAHTCCLTPPPRIFLISQTVMYTKMPNREKARWSGKAFVSRWKASHPLATCRASSDTFPRQRILKQRLCRHTLASIHPHTHQHGNTLASSLPLPFSIYCSLSVELWCYSSLQKRLKKAVWLKQPPRRISSHESPRQSSLVFPHRCFSTVSSQAWNILITTRRVWKTALTMMLDNYFPFTSWLQTKIACHRNKRAGNRYAHQKIFQSIFFPCLKASSNHRLLDLYVMHLEEPTQHLPLALIKT